jgi:hypothetical protein
MVEQRGGGCLVGAHHIPEGNATAIGTTTPHTPGVHPQCSSTCGPEDCTPFTLCNVDRTVPFHLTHLRKKGKGGGSSGCSSYATTHAKVTVDVVVG